MKMIMKTVTHVLPFALLSLPLACASSGFSKTVRSDVQSQISSIQSDLASCYSDALKRDRKAQGTVVVSFIAKSGTGKFEDVKVIRSDINDPALQECVVGKVSGLALVTPVKNQVAIEYPLAFSARD